MSAKKIRRHFSAQKWVGKCRKKMFSHLPADCAGKTPEKWCSRWATRSAPEKNPMLGDATARNASSNTVKGGRVGQPMLRHPYQGIAEISAFSILKYENGFDNALE